MTTTPPRIEERNPLPRLFAVAVLSWVAAFAALAGGTVGCVVLVFADHGVIAGIVFVLGLAAFYACQRDAFTQSEVFGGVRRLRQQRAEAERKRQQAADLVGVARAAGVMQPTRLAPQARPGLHLIGTPRRVAEAHAAARRSEYLGRHAVDTPTRAVRTIHRSGAWKPVVIAGGAR